jgi:hypothetical protein
VNVRKLLKYTDIKQVRYEYGDWSHLDQNMFSAEFL